MVHSFIVRNVTYRTLKINNIVALPWPELLL